MKTKTKARRKARIETPDAHWWLLSAEEQMVSYNQAKAGKWVRALHRWFLVKKPLGICGDMLAQAGYALCRDEPERRQDWLARWKVSGIRTELERALLGKGD